MHLIGPTIAIGLAIAAAAANSMWLMAAAIIWVTVGVWATFNYGRKL